LVDYVNGLKGSLSRAEQLTRAGELGPAVWAYLEVLELDPDNPAARRQVGQVATAVRQFDRTVPGRRWAQGMPFGAAGEGAGSGLTGWVKGLLIVMAMVLAFGLGFLCGQGLPGEDSPPEGPKKEEVPNQPNKQLGPAVRRV